MSLQAENSTSLHWQALDVDALVGEGLQLDLIEQMKLLALEQDKELEEPSVDAQDAQKAIFDKRIPSTKVSHSKVLEYSKTEHVC